MATRKQFLLRIDPEVWADVEKSASDELRSVNAQVEHLLGEAVGKRKGGRAANAARPPLRFPAASRSRYSTCALPLRSSSEAHFSTSAHTSGSMRSRNCLRAAMGQRLSAACLTCTGCPC